MSFRMYFTAAIAALLIPIPGAVGAKSHKVTHQIPLTDDFTEQQLQWTGGLGGYEFRWKTIVTNGVIEICGVGFYSNVSSRWQTKDSLRKAYIKYQDKVVMKDITFFSRVKSRTKLKNGTMANCASTGVKAPNGRYSVSLGWPGGRARF